MTKFIGHKIDISTIPEYFPTNNCSPEFWEALGRTIASFGFLEEILGKAIFALTAIHKYETEIAAEKAYAEWPTKLKMAITSPLANLVDIYEKELKKQKDPKIANPRFLIAHIKKLVKIRNAICHGSWQIPDNLGNVKLRFRYKDFSPFKETLNIERLYIIQDEIASISISVINSITMTGWNFPGVHGPGKDILPLTQKNGGKESISSTIEST